MHISAAYLEQVIEHARRDAPNECCGVIVVRDGSAEAVHELKNVRASPRSFEVDGLVLHHLLTAAEDDGATIGAIYHSHTRSDPVPSQTDINFAAGWPGVEWLIVGLASEEPVVRSFLIDDGEVREVEVARA